MKRNPSDNTETTSAPSTESTTSAHSVPPQPSTPHGLRSGSDEPISPQNLTTLLSRCREYIMHDRPPFITEVEYQEWRYYRSRERQDLTQYLNQILGQ